jgi:hypothetical protein
MNLFMHQGTAGTAAAHQGALASGKRDAWSRGTSATVAAPATVGTSAGGAAKWAVSALEPT